MRDIRFSVSRFATVHCSCPLIKMLHKNGQIGQGILLKGLRLRDYDSILSMRALRPLHLVFRVRRVFRGGTARAYQVT